MIFKLLLPFIFILSVEAGDIEGFFGAQYTQYKRISADYNQHGVSARLKYNRYKSGESGLTAFTFWNGHSVFAGDFMLGYGTKSGGSVYFEAAAYGAFSVIWGPGFAVLGSMGFDLGSKYYFTIPVVFRFPAYLGIAPMFGYRF